MSERSYFHAKDGWCFERLESGAVHVWNPALGPNCSLMMTPDMWASVVASVSVRGDNAQDHHSALMFHDTTRMGA